MGKLKPLLDTFWVQEPFGFDHPDTYNGILKLMEQVERDAYKHAALVAHGYIGDFNTRTCEAVAAALDRLASQVGDKND